MKTRYLFPFKYKKVGWILFLTGLILGVVAALNDYESPVLKMKVFAIFAGKLFENGNSNFTWFEDNVINELVSVIIILGGLLVAFSKTKLEDEYISRIRMESLIWATYVNYGVLLIAVLFVFELAFLDVMIYNMFTILIFFVLRFYFMLSKTKKQLSHEE